MKQTQQTAWSEFFAPDATSDRGWLKALCAPWSLDNRLEYTHETMPVGDETVPGGWREQSTLGNYLDYSVCRPYATGPQVHAVCYPTKTAQYFATVAEAKAWIESEAQRVRPELVFQHALAFAS